MAHEHLTRRFARTEEAIITLFCLVDDAYHHLNPRARRYESLKRLSDSEVIALALFEQSCEASRASARSSCATSSGSSRTYSPELWGSTLPRSTGG
jgi:hypothetical protein